MVLRAFTAGVLFTVGLFAFVADLFAIAHGTASLWSLLAPAGCFLTAAVQFSCAVRSS
jgi:uncharacterized membrane protein YgdD (TMEM256/DUF423 family)